MAEIKKVQEAIERIAPPHLAEEWDNSGFQIRCAADRQIKRILVALEISDEVISEAISEGVELILTHHPLIFGKIASVDDNTVTGHYLLRLISAGISVYSAHTSFDSARYGTNQYLAEQIGLRDIRPLLRADEQDCGMGREGVFTEPLEFDAFMERLIDVCDTNIYRIAAGAPERVGRVSICTGAGAEFLTLAKENGSDIYVTGDVKYHDARMACERGICVVDAGHFGTENIFSKNFAAQLAAEDLSDVKILVSHVDLNPFRPYLGTGAPAR